MNQMLKLCIIIIIIIIILFATELIINKNPADRVRHDLANSDVEKLIQYKKIQF